MPIKNLNYICIAAMCYFTGIAIYSIAPNLIRCLFNAEIPLTIKRIFYWSNNTISVFAMLYNTSVLIPKKSYRFLMKTVSFFMLLVGIFQIINCMLPISDNVWIFISTTALLLNLISFKHVFSKFQ